jgi:hypothetical protein
MVILAVGVAAARLIGNRQGPSTFEQIFTNSDGSLCEIPCVFGIEIGKTTSHKAIDLLKAHPMTRQAYITVDGRTTTIQGTGLYIVFREDEHKQIGLNSLTIDDQTLAGMIAVLGAPDCVGFWRSGGIGLLYSRYKLGIGGINPGYNPTLNPPNVESDRLGFNTVVSDVSVRNEWTCSIEIMERKLHSFGGMSHWRGFASSELYSRYP